MEKTEMRAEISPSNLRHPDVALRLTRFIGVRFCYSQMRRETAKKSIELADETPCEEVSGGITRNHSSYHGQLGEVSNSGRRYFAWKEGSDRNLELVRVGYGVSRLELKTRFGMVGPF